MSLLKSLQKAIPRHWQGNRFLIRQPKLACAMGQYPDTTSGWGHEESTESSMERSSVPWKLLIYFMFLLCKWLPEASTHQHSHSGLIPREQPKLLTHSERISYCPNQGYKDQGELKPSSLNRSSKGQGRSSPVPILPSTSAQFGSQCQALSEVQHPYREENYSLPAPLS